MLSDAVGQSTRHLVEQHELRWGLDLDEVATAGAFGAGYGGALGYLTRPPGPLPPLPKVPVEVPPLEEAWTAGRVGSGSRNAMRHFRSHGADFPEVSTLEEYVNRAWAFLPDPPEGTLWLSRKNGDIVRYQPSTNTFGILDANGVPRSYYRPDPAMHERPTNLEYFYDQRW